MRTIGRRWPLFIGVNLVIGLSALVLLTWFYFFVAKEERICLASPGTFDCEDNWLVFIAVSMLTVVVWGGANLLTGLWRFLLWLGR